MDKKNFLIFLAGITETFQFYVAMTSHFGLSKLDKEQQQRPRPLEPPSAAAHCKGETQVKVIRLQHRCLRGDREGLSL